MRILVIGGAGYIGSHVVKSLLEAGMQVRVLDDLSTGQKINLFQEAEFIEGNMLDEPLLNQVMQGVDAVIHLAAKKSVNESMLHPEKYATNNIVGAVNVLNAMTQHNVKYFVFSSTAAVYGMPQYPKLDELHPVHPINFYGFTKLEIENMLGWYDQLKGIKFVSLRYFNAVGYDAAGDIKGLEKNPQNLLPIVMETAVGVRPEMYIYGNDYETPDGTCIRDYIHVSDLANAHTLAIRYLAQENTSQIFNLGTETGHSVQEMLTLTEKVIGRKINYKIGPRRLGDPAALTAVAQKANKILGWKPQHSDLDNIIQTTWAVYQKHYPEN